MSGYMEEIRLRDGNRSDMAKLQGLADLSNVDGDGSLIYPECRSPSASHSQHICVVTETYPPEINGVALTLAHLVNGLLARGHKVSVVHPKQRNRRASDDFRRNCYSEAIVVPGLPLPGYH